MVVSFIVRRILVMKKKIISLSLVVALILTVILLFFICTANQAGRAKSLTYYTGGSYTATRELGEGRYRYINGNSTVKYTRGKGEDKIVYYIPVDNIVYMEIN